MNAQKGFTLIELMIVVAIIGILAAIALPAYQTYMVKSKLVEATTDLDAAKVAVAEAYSTNDNKFPKDSPIPPLGANAKYVKGLTYTGTDAGPITIVVELTGTNNAKVDGKFIGLTGTGKADGTVSWSCSTFKDAKTVGADTELYPFLPTNCQNGG